MVKYNYAKLLGKIRESGNTQESLAIKVKMSPSTLNLKLNNKRDFTQKQIKKICEELHIENVNEYFFCQNTLENARIGQAENPLRENFKKEN